MPLQSAVATFTGSEPYQDLSWSDHYNHFVNFGGLPVVTDGSAPVCTLSNPSNPALPPDNTGVRVTPTAPFSGKVTVFNMEVTP